MNLKEIIPLPVLDFKARYWRSKFMVSEGPPGRFSHLLDAKKFFALCRAGRAFDVVSGGIHTPVISARPEYYARQGLPLVLMDVQNKSVEVADLLANLMMDLAHCGQGHVNAYYNPRAGKGLGAHKDAEDLLILQLEGTKHWQVAAPPGARRKSSQVYSFALNPGDAMYLPFEAPHRAESRSGATLHLTFGFYPKKGSARRSVKDAIERSIKNPAWPPAAGASKLTPD